MPHVSTWRGRLLIVLLTASARLAAQQPAYDLSLTEPDQELDDSTHHYAGLHQITPHLRGVRGAGNTLYWVSSDSKQLIACKHGRKLLQTNISQAFTKLLPNASIERFALSSQVIFLFTTGKGHAEIDRATGSIADLGAYAN